MGTVVGIYSYPLKGEPGVWQEEAFMEEGKGLWGDCHAAGGDRQVTMITFDTVRWMEEQNEKGLCFRKFGANLIVKHIEAEKLKPKTRLFVGQTILEISEVRKKCYKELCEFAEQDCLLTEGVRYLKVIKAGAVKIDDVISSNQSDQSASK